MNNLSARTILVRTAIGIALAIVIAGIEKLIQWMQ